MYAQSGVVKSIFGKYLLWFCIDYLKLGLGSCNDAETISQHWYSVCINIIDSVICINTGISNLSHTLKVLFPRLLLSFIVGDDVILEDIEIFVSFLA